MSSFVNKMAVCSLGFNSFQAAVAWTTSCKVQPVTPAAVPPALELIQEDEASSLLTWVYEHPLSEPSSPPVPVSPRAEPSPANSQEHQEEEDDESQATEEEDQGDHQEQVPSEPWLESPPPGLAWPTFPPTLASFSSTPPVRVQPNPPRDDPSWGASWVEAVENPIDIGGSICFPTGAEEPVMPADRLFPLGEPAGPSGNQEAPAQEPSAVPAPGAWAHSDLPAPIFFSSLAQEPGTTAEELDELDIDIQEVANFVLDDE